VTNETRTNETAPHTGGITVGVDGSPGSTHALAWANERTGRFGPIQPVTTWHYPWWALSAPIAGATPPLPDAELRDDARQRVLETLAELPVGSSRDPEILRGAAGPAIVKIGSTSDLIVVGTRGHGAVADRLLGSVSCHVAANASVPVAIVPAAAPIEDLFNRVVVGIDGSENSIDALAWAMQNVPSDATIDVVNVWTYSLTTAPELASIPVEHFELEGKKALDRTIEEARSRTGDSSRVLVPHLVYGDPRQQLRMLATEADMLVLGAQGHTGLAFLILGSVTTGLIHDPATTTVIVPDLPK
jgi:nucleotide-binding universal stress UspA family protein